MDGDRPVERHDVVVVGAGQSGLAVSWYLQLFGVDHVVLDRGAVGESWRSVRWDSFTLVTPAWMTRLPGLVQPGGTAETFTARHDVVALLESYSASLPVRPGVEVTSVQRAGEGYRLTTSDGPVNARAVVAASGAQCVGMIPALADRLPQSVRQLHAGQYRNPSALPEGGILVVGSGQSGGQIADELAQAGRRVFLATSRVGRVPRRYRGRDAHDWSQEMGLHDRRVDQAQPAELEAAHPLLSGAHGGRTLSLQQLARDGVVLLGRLLDIHGPALQLGDDLAENVRFGDRAAAAFRRSVDEYIDRLSLSASPPDFDPAERPSHHPWQSPLDLDLMAAGVRTVIWCVGFGPSTAWIDLPVLDTKGHIRHNAGIAAIPGFYTLGAPWLTHRGSGILYGVDADASRIARHVAAFLRIGTQTRGQAADQAAVAVPLAS